MHKKLMLTVILLILASLPVFSTSTFPSTQFQIHWIIRNTNQMEAEIGLYSFGTNTALQTTTISLVPSYGEQAICTMYYTTNYIGADAGHPVTHHFTVTVTPLVNTQDADNKLPVVIRMKRENALLGTFETFTRTDGVITAIGNAQNSINVDVSQPATGNLNRMTLLFDFYADLTEALNSASMTASAVYSSNITVGVVAP